MGIGLFKRPYTLRRYKPQAIKDGYAESEYTDIIVKLNVQPLAPNDYLALPEGERTVKRVKTFGFDQLTSADELSGTPGDRLWYLGAWWECKSSAVWDVTLLRHFQSNFVILPQRAQEAAPLPPRGGGAP